MVRFVTCLLLSVGVIFAVVLFEGGRLLALFALSPFLLVVLVPVLASLAVYRPKDLLRAFNDAFTKKKPDGRSEEICRFYEKMFIVVGVIGTLLGVIVTLGNLRELANMGSPLAVTLLCPLYAAIFYLITRVWRTKLKNGK